MILQQLQAGVWHSVHCPGVWGWRVSHSRLGAADTSQDYNRALWGSQGEHKMAQYRLTVEILLYWFNIRCSWCKVKKIRQQLSSAYFGNSQGIHLVLMLESVLTYPTYLKWSRLNCYFIGRLWNENRHFTPIYSGASLIRNVRLERLPYFGRLEIFYGTAYVRFLQTWQFLIMWRFFCIMSWVSHWLVWNE